MPNALEVDLKGLRQLVQRRGKAFVICELIQNCWDEDGVTQVGVSLERIRGTPLVTLTIVDDAPDGFQDLRHAYTLFAPSKKKDNAEKRGRFNLGEKLVIAMAERFQVKTTTGGVVIDVKKNERHNLRSKRERGSEVEVEMRMTDEEMQDTIRTFKTLLPSPNIRTSLNGMELAVRIPIDSAIETLPTEVADAEGNLRPSRRATSVAIYELRDGEVGTLYELGIPVVETGDTFHINVFQKVPLNTDRDNVTPSFLRAVRAIALNLSVNAQELTPESASANWVNEALEDDRVEKRSIEAVLTQRFGEQRVVYDPSDLEANRIAQSTGYQVVPGNAFSKPAWSNIRAAGALLPAGQVTPSPKAFMKNGKGLKYIEPDTVQLKRFVKSSALLHGKVIRKALEVRLTNTPEWDVAACYTNSSPAVMTVNLAHVQPSYRNEETWQVVTHEFGHNYGDHLTHAFDSGIAIVAARIALLAINEPEFLQSL